MFPKVSVIIPNYNHARYLTKRIESVLEQTYKNLEVIILDDCSKDNSKEVIEKYRSKENVKIFYNEKNSGSTFYQWNKGVNLASGEYIWLAESDDYASQVFLEKTVEILEHNKDVVLAYAQSHYIDENDKNFTPDYTGTVWDKNFIKPGHEIIFQYLIFGNIIQNASSALFRKSVYNQIGGADTTFKMAGDLKLWAEFALIGKFGYVKEKA